MLYFKRLKKAGANICLISICCMSSLLGGCQPTPETEVIVQKENIEDVVSEHSKDVEEGILLREQLAVPERISFEVSAGDITICANDAPVIVPETDRMGAATIVRRDFTEDEIKVMIELLFDGQTAYRHAPMLKADYEQIIADNNAYIAELRGLDPETYGGDIEAEIAQIEQIIAGQQEQMASAPETYEKIPVTYEWEKYDESMGMGAGAREIGGENKDGEMIYSFHVYHEDAYHTFYFSKAPKEGEDSAGLNKSLLPNDPAYQAEELAKVSGQSLDEIYGENICSYTKEEAQALVFKTLEEMGIDTENLYVVQMLDLAEYDFDAQKFYPGVLGYQMTMGHGFGGVGPTYATNNMTYTFGEEDDGTVPYDYENLLVTVDDHGISSISWMNPMGAVEELSAQVILKPYAEIETIIKENLPSRYEYFLLNYLGYENLEGVDAAAANAQVEKITLGMMRVKNKDAEDQYTLVPVWDVFMSADRNRSVLTVNAMDGSLISRESGY